MRDVETAIAADDSCWVMFMIYGYVVDGIINVCIFFRMPKLFFKCKNGGVLPHSISVLEIRALWHKL